MLTTGYASLVAFATIPNVTANFTTLGSSLAQSFATVSVDAERLGELWSIILAENEVWSEQSDDAEQWTVLPEGSEEWSIQAEGSESWQEVISDNESWMIQ